MTVGFPEFSWGGEVAINLKPRAFMLGKQPPLVTAESYLFMKTVNGCVSELFNKSTSHE